MLAALSAALLAAAFWSVGRGAALRRGLRPGHLPCIVLAAAAFTGSRTSDLSALAAICGALACAAIDARTGIIPDPLTAATGLTALASAARNDAFGLALTGALIAGGALFALHLLTAGRGLGLGDVKLAAAIGLGLGPLGGITAVAGAFVLGGAFATWLLLTRRARRGSELRFGPFLAAGACGSALLPPGFFA
jgi:leader peptidase (prepilin peptidase) / N-methyltransferase